MKSGNAINLAGLCIYIWLTLHHHAHKI